MAILTPEQLAKLQQIIRDAATSLAITTTGYQVPDEELQRLIDEGYIDPKDLENIVWDAFTFGQVSAKHEAIKQMGLPQFEKYLAKNPVVLSDQERKAFEVAKDRAGMYCVGLGNRFAGDLTGQVIQYDQELAQRTRKMIADETAIKIATRATRGELRTRLRQLTQDFSRDWDRIANTETHMAMEEGYLNATVERHGEGALIAKVVEPDSCQRCRDLYLEDDKPMIRPASWWQEQGVSNAGRKSAEWKPVLGAAHPHCFPAGSQVQTAKGRAPIESLKVGDWIVSAEGNWRSVTATFKHYYVGPMFTLRCELGVSLTATKGHLLRGSSGWTPIELVNPGDSVGQILLSETDHGPALGGQESGLARILLGFTRSGMPVSAIYLDGELYRPIGEIDEETINRLIRPKTKPGSLEGVIKLPFKVGENSSGLPTDQLKHPALRQSSTPNCFVSSRGPGLALLGGSLLHADLHRFAHTSLAQSSFSKSGSYNGPTYPEFSCDLLHSEIFVKVQSDEFVDREIDPSGRSGEFFNTHSAYIRSRLVNVKSLEEQYHWEGYVYNLSVEGDETYTVSGVGVHNCRCKNTRVPNGWEFNDAWDLEPSEESEEKSLTKSHALDYKTEFQGFPISIENRKGSIRRWYDPHTDTKGQTKMSFPYGYIRLTEGTDGDHVDVFLGPNEKAKNVYIVNQMKAPSFTEIDEQKTLLGFTSAKAAKAAYLAHFDRPEFFGSMRVMPVEEFRAKVHAKRNQGELIKAWGAAILKAGLTPRAFQAVIKSAQEGAPEARKTLQTVYEYLGKGYQAGTVAGLGTTMGVGTMGNWGKPARTANEGSALAAQANLDYPAGRLDQKGKRRQKRKLPTVREKYDVTGLKQDGGWNHEYQWDRVEGRPDGKKRQEVSPYREDLETQQAQRQKLRESHRLSEKQ